MTNLDNILKDLDGRYPQHRKVAKHQLYELLVRDVIGDDEKPVRGMNALDGAVWEEHMYVMARNEFRKQQRTRLAALCGVNLDGGE